MATNPLLPPNASWLEHAVSLSLADACNLPVPLRTLWQPWHCPLALLPWLAWALSVDRWDERWGETQKRQAIADSFFVHKHKGTVGALRRVVEPLGYLVSVTEWHQCQPPGPRGTFALEISLREQGISPGTLQELERAIDDAKPLSRHLTGLALILSSRGQSRIASASLHGDVMTISPYTEPIWQVSGQLAMGGGVHSIETTTIGCLPS